MPYVSTYCPETLDRATLDARAAPLVLEFGTNWCGQCRAAQPSIEGALTQVSGFDHIKVEDGPGRPLGRSFRVKLWPTLVFWRDGQEVGRLVRPGDQAMVQDALQALLHAE